LKAEPNCDMLWAMRRTLLALFFITHALAAQAQPGTPEAEQDVLDIVVKLHVAEGWANGLEKGLAAMTKLPVTPDRRPEFEAAVKAEFAAEAPGYMQLLVAREAAALSDQERANLLVFVDLPSIKYQSAMAAGLKPEGPKPMIGQAEADTLHRIDGDYIGQFIADMTSAGTLTPLTDRIMAAVLLKFSK